MHSHISLLSVLITANVKQIWPLCDFGVIGPLTSKFVFCTGFLFSLCRKRIKHSLIFCTIITIRLNIGPLIFANSMVFWNWEVAMKFLIIFCYNSERWKIWFDDISFIWNSNCLWLQMDRKKCILKFFCCRFVGHFQFPFGLEDYNLPFI